MTKHIPTTEEKLAVINARVIDPKLDVKTASRQFDISEKHIKKIWKSVDLKSLTEELYKDLQSQLDDEDEGQTSPRF